MSIARKIALSRHAREHKSPATKQRTSAANINRHLRADVDMKQSVLIVAATMLCNATLAGQQHVVDKKFVVYRSE